MSRSIAVMFPSLPLPLRARLAAAIPRLEVAPLPVTVCKVSLSALIAAMQVGATDPLKSKELIACPETAQVLIGLARLNVPAVVIGLPGEAAKPAPEAMEVTVPPPDAGQLVLATPPKDIDLVFATVRLPFTIVSALNVCAPVQVLAFAKFKEAMTAPVVGEIVKDKSVFETEVTVSSEQVIIPDELIDLTFCVPAQF